MLKDRAVFVNDRLKELETLLSSTKEEKVIFHPNMADKHHAEVRNLVSTLNNQEARVEASLDLSRNCAALLTAYYALKENTDGKQTNSRI